MPRRASVASRPPSRVASPYALPRSPAGAGPVSAAVTAPATSSSEPASVATACARRFARASLSEPGVSRKFPAPPPSTAEARLACCEPIKLQASEMQVDRNRETNGPSWLWAGAFMTTVGWTRSSRCAPTPMLRPPVTSSTVLPAARSAAFAVSTTACTA